MFFFIDLITLKLDFMHVFAQEVNLLCVSYFPGNFKRIYKKRPLVLKWWNNEIDITICRNFIPPRPKRHIWNKLFNACANLQNFQHVIFIFFKKKNSFPLHLVLCMKMKISEFFSNSLHEEFIIFFKCINILHVMI